jgi:phenylacetate-CoA ligase
VREVRAAQRVLRAEPAKIQALADRRLAEVAAAARTVEPYRTLWSGLGEIRSREDLLRLPLIDRRDLQATPLESRVTRPLHGLQHRLTAGTSGAPLATARAPEELRFLDAMMWRQLGAQGIPPDAPRLDLDFDLRRETAELEVGGQVTTLSLPESPSRVAGLIRTDNVQVLMAYPSALLEIAAALGKATMKGVITFGEIRTAGDAAALQEAFGIRPMDLYGATEVATISWECPSGSGYHVNADAVMLEVLDPDGRPAAAGEPGDVVVTSLWNRTAPLIRYRLDDIASLLPGPCPCGITLPLMGLVEGRTIDRIVAPGGRRISPFRVMPTTLLGEEFGRSVRRCRMTQREADDFLVEVAWRSGRRDDLVARMAPAISWVLGAPVRVECRDVAEIRNRPAEKFRPVVSLVSPSGSKSPAV